ncbi:MAG: AmmeMemoRadiSam system protein A [FCB group bacterium]|nr:AmmeMemoRadiSam system protein A [FCB group bacterium]
MKLSPEEQQALLQYARRSIKWGLEHTGTLTVSDGDLTDTFRQPASTFVTLHLGEDLRGCIGRLKSNRPLLTDVIENAHSAAFADYRFPPVTAPELGKIIISISVLSRPHALYFKSEEDLLGQLVPGTDGLILSVPGHTGTFLPSVWESLPTPREFLEQLKRKAGLPAAYWSDDISIERYHTLEFSERDV